MTHLRLRLTCLLVDHIAAVIPLGWSRRMLVSMWVILTAAKRINTRARSGARARSRKVLKNRAQYFAPKLATDLNTLAMSAHLTFLAEPGAYLFWKIGVKYCPPKPNNNIQRWRQYDCEKKAGRNSGKARKSRFSASHILSKYITMLEAHHVFNCTGVG